MRKFKVKEGSHIQDGVKYTKGQVVNSPIDLGTLFRGKFEEVAGTTPAPALETPPPAPPSKSKKKGKKDEEPFGDDD